MDKAEKTYLMVAGALLPAFIGVGLYSIIAKKPITAKDSEFIILFAGLCSIGGCKSAKIIKKYDKPII